MKKPEEEYNFNNKYKPIKNPNVMRTRILTSAICIVALFSVDLAYGRYPVSPYAYVANNPVKYVDPDGKEIRLAGTTAQRQTILTHMQKLTNDRLSMRSDGTVIIVRMGGENSGRALTTGSELIRDLNQKGDGARIVTISIGRDGNSASTVDRNSSGNADWTNANKWDRHKCNC